MTQLIITLNDDNTVNVAGPIDNKLVSLGLLEVAKDAILEHHKASQNKIQPATRMPVGN